MTLFTYDNCKCRKINNKNVVALANILPVSMCKTIGEYSNIRCDKCRFLLLKEQEFMKNQDMPDEGLEKA